MASIPSVLIEGINIDSSNRGRNPPKQKETQLWLNY